MHTIGRSCWLPIHPKPEYVAVLDDDEFPAPHWLEHMIQAARRFGADIVGGPVFPVYAKKDHWLTKTGLYMPPALQSGIVPMIFGAGSMLIRTSLLAEYLTEPFPNEYAFTGGSDLDFSVAADLTDADSRGLVKLTYTRHT